MVIQHKSYYLILENDFQILKNHFQILEKNIEFLIFEKLFKYS